MAWSCDPKKNKRIMWKLSVIHQNIDILIIIWLVFPACGRLFVIHQNIWRETLYTHGTSALLTIQKQWDSHQVYFIIMSKNKFWDGFQYWFQVPSLIRLMAVQLHCGIKMSNWHLRFQKTLDQIFLQSVKWWIGLWIPKCACK